MFFDYIDAKIFILSFSIGIFYTYVKGDDMKKIYIYPTPENYNNFIIEDNAGQCFQYKAKEVSCKNKTISKIPIQK